MATQSELGNNRSGFYKAICCLVVYIFLCQTLNPVLLGYAPSHRVSAPQTETAAVSMWQRLLDFVLPVAQAQIGNPLLAATPEFDLADPYLIEKANELGRDPQRIFAFVRDEIGFESYTGSLRGARGTLWSKAGNALDKASLMIGLLRVSGIPARYVQGALSDELSKQLILSMFSMPCKIVGVIAEGAKLSDPANDPQLLAETREHYWVEFGNSGGFTAADPTFKESQLGQRFTGGQQTFAEVPDNLRHKVTIRLKAEITGALTGLAGGGADLKIPLQKSFNTVELVGHPLSIGHFVNSYSPPALIFGFTTHTYSPYILVGQDDGNIADDHIIRGEDYQEFLTNFPLASQFLTGVFLEMDIIAPGGEVETYERALVDRIGFAVRKNGGNSDLNFEASGPPVINDLDFTSIYILPGLQSHAHHETLGENLKSVSDHLDLLGEPRELNMAIPDDAKLYHELYQLFQKGYVLKDAILATKFAVESDIWLETLKRQYLLAAYYDSPRIVITGRLTEENADGTMNYSSFIDLRKSDIRKVITPGQSLDAAIRFNSVRGFIDSSVETFILEDSSSNKIAVSAFRILEKASQQGVNFALVFQTIDLELLTLSPEAKARINEALKNKRFVYAPIHPVVINGKERFGWYEFDLQGNLIGVTEDGGHQSLGEYAVGLVTIGVFVSGIYTGWQLGKKYIDTYDTTPVNTKDLGEIMLNVLSMFLVSGGGTLSNGSTFMGSASSVFVIWLSVFFIGLGIGTFIAAQFDPLLPDTLIGLPICDISPSVTEKGVTVQIVSDEIFMVPFEGMQLPTSFRAVIRNLGSTRDAFRLQFPIAPPGFEIQSSLSAVAIESGQAAEIGVYLRPVGTLPFSGTSVSFGVAVTSTTNPLVTANDSESFAMPEVPSIILTGNPIVLSSTPGMPVPATLTVKSAGNAPLTDVALAITTSPGLVVNGLTSPITLNAGESVNQALTLIPAANAPLNSNLTATITATYGPATSPQTTTTQLTVQVVTATARSAIDASLVASEIGRPRLGSTLNSLGTALTTLAQDPTSEAAQSRATGLLNSLIEQLNVPALTPFIADLTAARDAITSGEPARIQTALDSLSTTLGGLTTTLQSNADALPFEIALQPNSAVALPNTPTRFGLYLKNIGDLTTTYNLSLTGVPAGITAQLSQTSITLPAGYLTAPGVSGTNVVPDQIYVTLTQPSNQLSVFEFGVLVSVAGAPQRTRTAYGAFTSREELVNVVAVQADPPFTEPGGQVAISARLLNAVNQDRNALITYTVRDAKNELIFPPSAQPIAQPIALTVLSSLDTFRLGTLDTTGYARGSYSLAVTVTEADGSPIPGGTGQGTLLIGSPIQAALSATPQTLPPGDGTVTTSLEINSQVDYSQGGIQLMGLVDTDATAKTVAIRDQYAYVCGSTNISVVNISDPLNPKVVRTFGDGAYNKISCALADDKLLVNREVNRNLNLTVYSLSNPLNPQELVSDVNAGNFGTSNVHTLKVSNFALVNTLTYGWYGWPWFEFAYIRGDLLIFDISDPAPQSLGLLFGSDYFIGAQADAKGSYVLLPSTSEKVAATSGTGRLLIVNTQATKPVLAGSFDIPGTRVLTGIAIQGNQALITGSTGGFVVLPNNSPALSGKLTFTLLDITNPLQPVVLGTTVTDLDVNTLTGTTVTAGSDGFYAINQMQSGGNPVVLLVNARNPAQMTLTTLQVPTTVSDSQIAGNVLYTSSDSGLASYDIGSLTGTQITAQIRLPKGILKPNSFNIAPDQMSSTSDTDTLTWRRVLSATQTHQTITWDALVNDLQPGEFREIVTGGTVSFVANAVPGQIPLPPLAVTSEQILALTPVSRTAQVGEAFTYTVTVRNPTAAAVPYQLTVQGVPHDWVNLVPSVTVPAQRSVDLILTLQADKQAAAGENGFVVVANAANGTRAFVHGKLILQSIPGGGGGLVDLGQDIASDAHGIVMSLTPQQLVAGQGTAATYRVRLTNTGNVTERLTLTANLPAGISGIFSQDTMEVPPGLDNYREVSVTLQAATGSTPGNQPFTLTATATTPNLSDQVTGTVQISRYGVAVDLTPTSGVPPSTYQVTVHNTGQARDTFKLALGGPVAPVASLASTELTLDAGASQTVTLQVGAIDFAYPGNLDLNVIATSQSDPAVQATATTQLTITTSQQIEATVTPTVVNLPAPGQGTFLILVQNTGNQEGAYQARISTLSGNDTTANLTGLDNQPTPMIDTFRLPGLATGAIALNVAKASSGTASVTVTVTHLDQTAVQDVATATLQIANQAPVANAGADRTLLVGQEVTLDGTGSDDSDHGPQRPLAYQWTFLAVPANSRLQNADLRDASTAQPRFTTDVSGVYQLQLTVYDGELSATDSVTIQATNNPPVADAGPDLNLKLGTIATLDSSNSFDPDGQLIRYAWRLVQQPAGSQLTAADLQGADTPTLRFTPDVAGQYQLELKVRDVELESDPDTVQVTAFAANVTPNARAGEDRNAYVNDPVTLDGSASFDPDNGPQPLGYQWRFLALPPASRLTDQAIANALLARASFVPDAAGIYRLALTVTDSEAIASDEVQITVALPNVAPNAKAGADGQGLVGQVVHLDGSESNDPDNSPQPLSYHWQFVSVPPASKLTATDLTDANSVTASFVPDVAGQYVLRLEVCDGASCSADNVLIEVATAPPATPPTVIIKGKGEGGSGGIGLLDLLLAALGLALWRRHSRRWRVLLPLRGRVKT